MHLAYANVAPHVRWGLYSWHMLAMTVWMTMMFRWWEVKRKKLVKLWRCVDAKLEDRELAAFREHPAIRYERFAVQYFSNSQTSSEAEGSKMSIKKGVRYVYPETLRNFQKLVVVPALLAFLAANVALGFGVCDGAA